MKNYRQVMSKTNLIVRFITRAFSTHTHTNTFVTEGYKWPYISPSMPTQEDHQLDAEVPGDRIRCIHIHRGTQ